MPHYSSEATVSPLIPKSLITQEDLAFFERFGLQVEQTEEKGKPMIYLYAPQYVSSDCGEDNQEVDVEDLAKRLREIIRRSKGKLEYLYVSIAYTCSRYLPGAFSGGAIFVTERSYRFTSIADWIFRQTEKLRKAKAREGGQRCKHSQTPKKSTS